MGTLSLESRVEVNRAMSCVMMVANTMCHVVKNKAASRVQQSAREGWRTGRWDSRKSKWADASTHLLKRMTLELSAIQRLPHD